jgi:hypothetical protein
MPPGRIPSERTRSIKPTKVVEGTDEHLRGQAKKAVPGRATYDATSDGIWPHPTSAAGGARPSPQKLAIVVLVGAGFFINLLVGHAYPLRLFEVTTHPEFAVCNKRTGPQRVEYHGPSAGSGVVAGASRIYGPLHCCISGSCARTGAKNETSKPA